MSRYESQMQKISAIDDVYKCLDEKQRDNYTSEQLDAWAHMIDLKKHSSYDEPPNKPFFVSKQKSSIDSSTRPMGISPSKRVNLQSECIDQLKK